MGRTSRGAHRRVSRFSLVRDDPLPPHARLNPRSLASVVRSSGCKSTRGTRARTGTSSTRTIRRSSSRTATTSRASSRTSSPRDSRSAAAAGPTRRRRPRRPRGRRRRSPRAFLQCHANLRRIFPRGWPRAEIRPPALRPHPTSRLPRGGMRRGQHRVPAPRGRSPRHRVLLRLLPPRGTWSESGSRVMSHTKGCTRAAWSGGSASRRLRTSSTARDGGRVYHGLRAQRGVAGEDVGRTP